MQSCSQSSWFLAHTSATAVSAKSTACMNNANVAVNLNIFMYPLSVAGPRHPKFPFHPLSKKLAQLVQFIFNENLVVQTKLTPNLKAPELSSYRDQRTWSRSIVGKSVKGLRTVMVPSRAVARKVFTSLLIQTPKCSRIGIVLLKQRRWLNTRATPQNPPRRTDTERKGPLSGIRVLDMTRVLAGVSVTEFENLPCFSL